MATSGPAVAVDHAVAGVGPPAAPERPAGIRASSAYLPELECLRGVAILLVALFHADADLRAPFGNTEGMWPAPWTALVLGGHTGVSLFFVLSAFLLSQPFLAEAAGGRPVSRATFYRRRVLRIVPLFWLVMLIGAVCTADTARDVLRAVPYMVFLHGIPALAHPFAPWTDVTWSLATEIQFYLLLPLLPLVLGTPARRRRGLVLLAAYAVAYAGLCLGAFERVMPGWLSEAVRFGVPGRGPFFLLGIAAAEIHRRSPTLWSRLLGRPWIADAVLVAALLTLGLLLRPVVRTGLRVYDLGPTFAWHVPEAFLWTLVVLLVVAAPLRVRPLLVNPALARLGVLSYSIYLLHQPMWRLSLTAARRLFRASAGWDAFSVAWLVGASLALLAVAEVSYRVVERPFLLRKQRLDA